MTSVSPSRRRQETVSGAFFVLGGAEIVLLMTVAEALYPGYSTHTNTISDLAAVGSPTWAFFGPAVFAWGLCWFLGAYYLFRGGGRATAMLNLMPGIGVMLAALSPENVNIAVHSLGAILAFVPGGVAAVLSYKEASSPLRHVLLFLGSLSLVATLVYFGGYSSSLVQQTLGSGGAERVVVYPLLIWLICFGSSNLARARRD